MAIASGIAKKLVIAEQSALGTIAAVDAATATYLRRVTSDVDLHKDTYQSAEIRTDAQMSDFRHGVRSVSGTIAGELSPGSYQLLMAGIMRKAWTAGVSMDVAGAANVAAATTAGAAGTFTRDDVDGSWLKDGFKVGDVVRFTGWTPGTANNNHNFLITALTSTVMTVIALDGVAIVSEAKGGTIACSVVGKKTWVPDSAHTDLFYTIEHNYSDLDMSEVFTDCKPGSMAIKLPATGMATIDIGIEGLNMTPKSVGDAPYFTGPSASSTKGVCAGVNGAVFVAGAPVALITGMDFTVNANLSSEPVVGSNVKPDIFDGRVIVTGNMTVFFQDATFRDYFVNETEVSVVAAFTCNNDAKADFIAFTMPRVKVGGASKDDGEKGLIMTMPFTALFNGTGGAATGATATNALTTTLSIQDSSLS